MNTRQRLIVISALVMLFAPLLGGSPAQAHSGEQSYVYLEIFDDAIAGRVEYPIKDLNRVLGLDIPREGNTALAAIEANAEIIQEYTSEHLSLAPSPEGAPWAYEFGDVEFLDFGDRSYAIFQFEIDQKFDPPPRVFHVSYDGIIEAGADRDAFLLIATDWGSGTFNNEANEFLRFTASDTDHLVDLDDTSWWKGFVGTVKLGAEHIRIGTDHILFVLALVIPSVLVFSKWDDDDGQEWHPSAGFVPTLWRVLKIVTMFTLAHSITLALGGLGIVELSPRFVEAVIALSIAAAALHNIRPIFVNKEWALAFGFGLFHGFGFAGLLSELGLDRSQRLPSLLGFNLGVELGQSAIILMVFPLLFIMRRSRLYKPLMFGGSIVLAVVAMFWAVERIFDTETNINSIVDPILKWPRAAIFVAIGYVISTAIWWFGKQRGDLLPVTDTAANAPADEEPEPALVDA